MDADAAGVLPPSVMSIACSLTAVTARSSDSSASALGVFVLSSSATVAPLRVEVRTLLTTPDSRRRAGGPIFGDAAVGRERARSLASRVHLMIPVPPQQEELVGRPDEYAPDTNCASQAEPEQLLLQIEA